MSTLFLTRKQLEELTGLVQPAAQIRWLQKNGVRHYIRADGHPRVPLTAIDREPAAAGAGTRIGPDLDAVRLRH